MIETVLFDLDGTITDSGDGILNCVRYALDSLDFKDYDPDELGSFIGPPLRIQFMRFCGFDEEKADKAVALYRERYREKGIYEMSLYPGITELFDRLKAAGLRLGVASSKPDYFLIQILKDHGLDGYFDVVSGAVSEFCHEDKREVMAYALEQLESAPGDGSREKTVLVGDRKYDAQGARLSGIGFIGVSYGFGSREELAAEQPLFIAADTAELGDFILGQSKGRN